MRSAIVAPEPACRATTRRRRCRDKHRCPRTERQRGQWQPLGFFSRKSYLPLNNISKIQRVRRRRELNKPNELDSTAVRHARRHRHHHRPKADRSSRIWSPICTFDHLFGIIQHIQTSAPYHLQANGKVVRSPHHAASNKLRPS